VLGHEGRVTGLAFASREPIDCDMVVATSGPATGFLPRRDRGLGRVWPVQGYSISAKATPAAMRVSITDVKRKIVFARLGDTVRAAGLADIGSQRFHFAPDRFEAFRSAAVAAFGPAFAHGPGDDVSAWSDGRPCTPSSRPVIRPGSLAGLYLNLGHGALGWTLCLGSARHLIDVIRRTS
jgi:D-amino-acid dehydrogenase